MTTRRLGDICLLGSRLHRPLQDQFVDVMPLDDARPGILRRLRGREDILPHPLAIGIGVCALQRLLFRKRWYALSTDIKGGKALHI